MITNNLTRTYTTDACGHARQKAEFITNPGTPVFHNGDRALMMNGEETRGRGQTHTKGMPRRVGMEQPG